MPVTDPRYKKATESDVIEDYVLYLAQKDNEDELTGKKQQDEWIKEMQDKDKFSEWQSKHTIFIKKKVEKVAKQKIIQLKKHQNKTV